MKAAKRKRGGRTRQKGLELPGGIETPTPEMLAKRQWRFEALENGGAKVYRAVSQGPLDRYLARGQIDEALFEAGQKLYRLWRAAGRAQKVTVSYRERIDRSIESDPGITRLDAWHGYCRALAYLPESLRGVVIAVCAHQQSAGDWAHQQGLPSAHGMGRLIAGLEDLARHFGKTGTNSKKHV